MAIYRWTWDPWRELTQLREQVEGAFGSFGRAVSAAGRPPINVFQSDEGLTVTAEVPGVEGENLVVEAEGDVLRISGERSAPEGVDDEAYHRRERKGSSFTREVRLPAGLNTEKVEASLSDGILTVHLPKEEAAKPRKIKVKGG